MCEDNNSKQRIFVGEGRFFYFPDVLLDVEIDYETFDIRYEEAIEQLLSSDQLVYEEIVTTDGWIEIEQDSEGILINPIEKKVDQVQSLNINKSVRNGRSR